MASKTLLLLAIRPLGQALASLSHALSGTNLNPLKNIRRWRRKSFPDPDQTKGLRHLTETETDRDLQKPAQQLLCDVHEECLNPLPPDTEAVLTVLNAVLGL